MLAMSERVVSARVHHQAANVPPMVRSTLAPPTQFADWVIAKAAERGLHTKAAIARAVGTDPSTVSRWLSSQNGLSVESLRKLAPALDVRIGDILVAAGLTPDEIGLVPLAPLPPQVREVMKILNSNEYSDREKRSLLSGIGRTLDGFHEAVEMSREAAERMNWGGRRAARTQR